MTTGRGRKEDRAADLDLQERGVVHLVVRGGGALVAEVLREVVLELLPKVDGQGHLVRVEDDDEELAKAGRAGVVDRLLEGAPVLVVVLEEAAGEAGLLEGVEGDALVRFEVAVGRGAGDVVEEELEVGPLALAGAGGVHPADGVVAAAAALPFLFLVVEGEEL